MAAARVNYSPAVLFSTMDAPFKTMKEMVEYAKANPGKVIHGNTGPWGLSDLPMKQAMKDYNFDVKIVPYDGGGPALTALLGGHIQTSIFLTAQSLPHIRAGKIRALAVLDTKRHPDLPDVATSVEQGINVTAILWRAVLAPKGTPRPIIEKLASAVKQTTEDPSFKAAIKQLGDVPGYAGPDEFTSIWQKEFETTKELAKAFKK
jgi:tripartite-type tricarboxylate transporter receptor subunit TctC